MTVRITMNLFFLLVLSKTSNAKVSYHKIGLFFAWSLSKSDLPLFVASNNGKTRSGSTPGSILTRPKATFKAVLQADDF